MSNQVKLVFAGEAKDLSTTMDRVGGDSERMSERVGRSGEGFERAGESADVAEQRAQGFSDTLTGTADVAMGTSEIMKGNLFEGFVMVGGGLADLAGGFADLLIPAVKNAVTAFKASTVGQYAAAAASKVWAAAQWLWNAAFAASGIGLIIMAVVALVAAIILIATKTDWFQRAWRVSWAAIKAAASATWDFLKKIPGWLGQAFSKVADFISRPFRAAFNLVARAWNNTIGRLSWSVPGWVPIIGGNSISVPNLPTFHSGGIVPGPRGSAVPIMALGGERVSSGAGGAITYVAAGDRLTSMIFRIVRDEVIAAGGDPSSIGLKIT